MKTIHLFKTFLKRIFCTFLIFNHLLIFSGPAFAGPKEDERHFRDIFGEEAAPHVIRQAHDVSVSKNANESYSLSSESFLNKQIVNFRDKGKIVGTWIHINDNDKDEFHFRGVNDPNIHFEIAGPLDLSSLFVCVAGNLRFLNDVTLEKTAYVESLTLRLGGRFSSQDSSQFIIHGACEVLKEGRLESAKSIEGTFNTFLNWGSLRIHENSFFETREIFQNNGEIEGAQQISVKAKNLFNRASLKAKTLVVEIKEKFWNNLSIETQEDVKASYCLFENTGSFKIGGSFLSKGKRVQNHRSALLEVGSLYQAHVEDYIDSGSNIWKGLATLTAQTADLAGKYTLSSTLIETRNALTVRAESSLQLSHFLALKSSDGTLDFGGKLFLNSSLPKPAYPRNSPQASLMAKIPRQPLVSMEGCKALTQRGNVQSDSSSILYSSREGHFHLTGPSRSGFFKDNVTEIRAHHATLAGHLKSFGDVIVDTQENLRIAGEIVADNLRVLAKTLFVSGSVITEREATLRIEKKAEITSTSSLKIGETLAFTTEGDILNDGKIHAKNTMLQGNTLTNTGMISADQLAHLKADTFFANWWGGSVKAKDIQIDAGLVLNFLGTVSATRGLTTNALIDVNLGLKTAHHITSNALFSLDAGLSLPALHPSDLLSWENTLKGLKAAALAFCPADIRSLINLGTAAWSIQQQASTLYEKYSSFLKDDPRFSDVIPLLVGTKDLAFSMYTTAQHAGAPKNDIVSKKEKLEEAIGFVEDHAVTQSKSSRERKVTEAVNLLVPDVTLDSLTSAANTAVNVFIPSNTRDSLVDVNAGIQVTGNAYKRALRNSHSGVTGAWNYTDDSIDTRIGGALLSKNIRSSNKCFQQTGHVIGGDINVNANTLDAKEGSTTNATNITLQGNKINHDGVVSSTNRTYVEATESLITGEKSSLKGKNVRAHAKNVLHKGLMKAQEQVTVTTDHHLETTATSSIAGHRAKLDAQNVVHGGVLDGGDVAHVNAQEKVTTKRGSTIHSKGYQSHAAVTGKNVEHLGTIYSTGDQSIASVAGKKVSNFGLVFGKGSRSQAFVDGYNSGNVIAIGDQSQAIAKENKETGRILSSGKKSKARAEINSGEISSKGHKSSASATKNVATGIISSYGIKSQASIMGDEQAHNSGIVSSTGDQSSVFFQGKSGAENSGTLSSFGAKSHISVMATNGNAKNSGTVSSTGDRNSVFIQGMSGAENSGRVEALGNETLARVYGIDNTTLAATSVIEGSFALIGKEYSPALVPDDTSATNPDGSPVLNTTRSNNTHIEKGARVIATNAEISGYTLTSSVTVRALHADQPNSVSFESDQGKLSNIDQIHASKVKVFLGKLDGGGQEAIDTANQMINAREVFWDASHEDFNNTTSQIIHGEERSFIFNTVSNSAPLNATGTLRMDGIHKFWTIADIHAQTGLTTTSSAGNHETRNGAVHSTETGKTQVFGDTGLVLGSTLQPNGTLKRSGYVGDEVKRGTNGDFENRAGQTLARNGNLTSKIAGSKHERALQIANNTVSRNVDGTITALQAEKKETKNPHKRVKRHDVSITYARTEDFSAGKTSENVGGTFTSEAGLHRAEQGGQIIARQRFEAQALQHTYTAEEWNYRKGFLWNQHHKGSHEATDFYRTEFHGQFDVECSEGGTNLKGALIEGVANVSGRDGIDLPAAVARNHSEENSSSGFGLLRRKRTRTDQEVAQVTEIISNDNVTINSDKGKVTGKGTHIVASSVDIYGAKGIALNPVPLESTSQEYSVRFFPKVLGIDLTRPFDRPILSPSLSVGLEATSSHTKIAYSHHGLIQTNHLDISTGERTQANLQGANILANTMTSNTDVLLLGGSRTERSTHSRSASTNLGVSYMGGVVPTGSLSFNQDKETMRGFQPAQVQINNFENKRENSTLSVANGIHGGIESAKGENFKGIIDYTQTHHSKSSSFGGIGFAGNTLSFSGGGAWGEKVSSEGTNFAIDNTPNMTNRQDIVYKDKDTRRGINLHVSLNPQASTLSEIVPNVGVSLQIKDQSFAVDSTMVTNFTNPAASSSGDSFKDLSRRAERVLRKTNSVVTIASKITSTAVLAGAKVEGLQHGLENASYAIDNAIGLSQIAIAARDMMPQPPTSSMLPSPIDSPEEKTTLLEEDNSQKTFLELSDDDTPPLKKQHREVNEMLPEITIEDSSEQTLNQWLNSLTPAEIALLSLAPQPGPGQESLLNSHTGVQYEFLKEAIRSCPSNQTVSVRNLSFFRQALNAIADFKDTHPNSYAIIQKTPRVAIIATVAVVTGGPILPALATYAGKYVAGEAVYKAANYCTDGSLDKLGGFCTRAISQLTNLSEREVAVAVDLGFFALDANTELKQLSTPRKSPLITALTQQAAENKSLRRLNSTSQSILPQRTFSKGIQPKVDNSGIFPSKKQLQKAGREGKQKKLRELMNDPKVSSRDRGWIQQEANQISRGKRKTMRLPPGYDLAHLPGYEAAKGFSYTHSVLQEKGLHRDIHKIDNWGKKNKTLTTGVSCSSNCIGHELNKERK